LRVIAHDMNAMEDALRTADDSFTPAATADDCVQASPVVVLLNSDPAYIDAIVGYRGNNPKVVVDCWRALDAQEVAANVRVVKFGFWEHCGSNRR
jgi:hypothetical protein